MAILQVLGRGLGLAGLCLLQFAWSPLYSWTRGQFRAVMRLVHPSTPTLQSAGEGQMGAWLGGEAGVVFLAPLCPWWSLGFSRVSILWRANPSSLLFACSEVKALCHHIATEAGQLSFNKGDILQVISKVDGDWLQCSLGSEKGLVPIMYVTHPEDEDY